jgi:hypothetical protein
MLALAQGHRKWRGGAITQDLSLHDCHQVVLRPDEDLSALYQLVQQWFAKESKECLS